MPLSTFFFHWKERWPCIYNGTLESGFLLCLRNLCWAPEKWAWGCELISHFPVLLLLRCISIRLGGHPGYTVVWACILASLVDAVTLRDTEWILMCPITFNWHDEHNIPYGISLCPLLLHFQCSSLLMYWESSRWGSKCLGPAIYLESSNGVPNSWLGPATVLSVVVI